mmetsp:Transcript_19925/g.48786  ORF Transcript_19925/g.48786 Transcript_19925/m.48786 type:complete len:234 (-) Transcript_19925:727-1428(-)
MVPDFFARFKSCLGFVARTCLSCWYAAVFAYGNLVAGSLYLAGSPVMQHLKLDDIFLSPFAVFSPLWGWWICRFGIGFSYIVKSPCVKVTVSASPFFEWKTIRGPRYFGFLFCFSIFLISSSYSSNRIKESRFNCSVFLASSNCSSWVSTRCCFLLDFFLTFFAASASRRFISAVDSIVLARELFLLSKDSKLDFVFILDDDDWSACNVSPPVAAVGAPRARRFLFGRFAGSK